MTITKDAIPTTILITGCSSGIGLAAAQILQQRGYRVIASARKPEDLARLQQLGLETVSMEMADPGSIQAGVDTVLNKTNGRLDALFNNAGFLQAGAIEDINDEMIRHQFAVNVFGPMTLIRSVLPIMRKQNHGRIIQNSSILGIIALPFYGTYNASKFALEGFTDTLRLELRNTPIKISTLNCGPIQSSLRDNAYQRYQHTIAKQTTVHVDAYQKMEASYFTRNAKHQIFHHPDLVITSLLHALESKHPHPHYYVGYVAKTMALLKRLLPTSVMDWVLYKISQI